MLIFDEVMTGFRVHPRGAQGLYGITPDLTTLGKVIGGGMPVGAFGGKRAIMEKIAPLGPVYQAGTLSGNPVAVAAGLATLREIEAPGFHDRLAATTASLTDGLAAAARRAGVPFAAQSVGGMFGLYFAAVDTGHLRRRDGLRQGTLQPLLSRDARRGRVPRPVGVRSRVRVRRAHRRRHRDDRRARREGLRARLR